MISEEQKKWIEKIAAFDMEILHKKGKDNVVVDAMSRKDEEPSYLQFQLLFWSGLMRFEVNTQKIHKQVP